MNFQSFDLKFLLIFVSIVKSDDEISCEQLSSIEIHPLECSIYPQFIDDLTEVTYKCSKLCKALPSPPFYCLKNCKIFESGVIVRGKFNGSKVINLFYEGGYKDPTNLTEKWTKVVKKSAKTCEKEVPTDTNIVSEDYNYFYTKFIECIRMENFMNSPDFSNSTNCEKIKEMMSKCDDSNYPLLHEFFFEDFYYKNNENVTLKWTTRTTTLGTPCPTEETSEETTEETTEEEISSTEEVLETKPAEVNATRPAQPEGARSAQPEGTRPAQPEATKSAQPEGTRPAQPKGTRAAQPEGTRPALPEGTKPPQPEATRPAQPEGTKPAQPEGTRPAQPVATRSAQPEGTRPAQPEGTRSAQPEGTRPAQPEGTRPAQPEGTKPAQPEGTRPAQPVATRPAQPEGTRPAQPEATRPAQPEGTRPAQPNKTATQADTLASTKPATMTSPIHNMSTKPMKSES